jgi:glucose-1-phosphate cytidylyltransferase
VSATVAVLCGGRGTRLREHTEAIPKPLVEIGGHPIVWHVIQLYVAQGFSSFVLLTGYKSGLVEAFARDTDWPAGVDVRCLDTGLDTPTGGRVHRARELLDGATFCVTYADGVADIDLDVLLDHHARAGRSATVTVVRPELPFGVAVLEDDRVTGFAEKPKAADWINGGFFCFEPSVFGVLGPDLVLEREPLERLAAQGQLTAHRHDGFWECMDTYKDAIQLNDLWAAGRAPWRRWG